MQYQSGIDLGDASDVDAAFARLQDRVQRAEGLLARALADDLSAASSGASGATGAIDMASAGRVAGMFRQSTPAQRNAVISRRREQVGEAQLRRELGAIATASRDEYQGVLARSGLRYGNLR